MVQLFWIALPSPPSPPSPPLDMSVLAFSAFFPASLSRLPLRSSQYSLASLAYLYKQTFLESPKRAKHAPATAKLTSTQVGQTVKVAAEEGRPRRWQEWRGGKGETGRHRDHHAVTITPQRLLAQPPLPPRQSICLLARGRGMGRAWEVSFKQPLPEVIRRRLVSKLSTSATAAGQVICLRNKQKALLAHRQSKS